MQLDGRRQRQFDYYMKDVIKNKFFLNWDIDLESTLKVKIHLRDCKDEDIDDRKKHCVYIYELMETAENGQPLDPVTQQIMQVKLDSEHWWEYAAYY